ncbi:L-serine deaminase II [Rhodovastum atsumiense]|uniref:L-serine dehydratase n=1 Tax=Rhodovastum atsumiense TaxID=504468 RepID=A0A5M6J0S7_9PROT|nr:L-serine ammonia-lyase [Rhodovastum atsumiense]KAA5614111.1 L-serine ammonia-lyase [Rhodovastum atsumiense]CAH2598955.1 L-serine deaminase II [Rhodovastum atsumiense]
MISVFDLYKIGIGPSSSHTVGPMRAAYGFRAGLLASERLRDVARLHVTLFGSLAWTGKGHGTAKAVILGLAGELPDTVDPDTADSLAAAVSARGAVDLGGHVVGFEPATDLVFDTLAPPPVHPNTLALVALDAEGREVVAERWCSVGGGFVVPEAQVGQTALAGAPDVPYPFRSGAELLRIGTRTRLSIAEIVMANESALRPAAEVEAHLDRVIGTMMACVERGMQRDGELPGGLAVQRRAARLRAQIEADRYRNIRHRHEVMDTINLYAIAATEENAAGGRVVTAPTNGAAGVLPAVLRYYREGCVGATAAGMHQFLLTATAIGALFKMNASISGAEVGCQGEVGVACSMAASGLVAALGGSNEQVENAAEIGMEHHLGMTCDPVGGLVQIPCIERNAFGAVKAVNAASLALRGDGRHLISLDKVIATMRQTGLDMQSKYKETSQGGLALNLPEC